MVAPVVTGALISGAASLLGGALSNDSNKAAVRAQTKLQREFAQHGIRWKVADAKAAGLHPLFAMGAQSPQFSPTIIPDSMGPALSEAGQNVGRAVAATLTPLERATAAAQLRVLESQANANDAQAVMFRSEALRNFRPGAEAGIPLSDGSASALPPGQQLLPEGQMPTGIHLAKPQESIIPRSNDPTTAAGINPGWSEFNVAPGMRMVLPTTSSDPAEALESVGESFILMLATYMENKRRYGQAWTDEFFKRYVPGGDFFLGKGGRDFVKRNREFVKGIIDKAGSKPPDYARFGK